MHFFLSFVLFVLISFMSPHVADSADEKAKTLSSQELMALVGDYATQYNVKFTKRTIFGFEQNFEHPPLSEDSITFRGVPIKPHLSSNKLSERAFDKYYPTIYVPSSVEDTLYYYLLMKKGFLDIKECPEVDSGVEEIRKKGVVWKKGDTYIYYVISILFEHHSIGHYTTFSFFQNDICGDDFSIPESKQP